MSEESNRKVSSIILPDGKWDAASAIRRWEHGKFCIEAWISPYNIVVHFSIGDGKDRRVKKNGRGVFDLADPGSIDKAKELCDQTILNIKEKNGAGITLDGVHWEKYCEGD